MFVLNLLKSWWRSQTVLFQRRKEHVAFQCCAPEYKLFCLHCCCAPPSAKNIAVGVWTYRNVDIESFVPVFELTTGVVFGNTNNNDTGAGESLNNHQG